MNTRVGRAILIGGILTIIVGEGYACIPPTADLIVRPKYALPGKPVILDGTGSESGTFPIAAYYWDVDNDGIYEHSETSSDTDFGKTVWSYANPGTYVVRMRVRDTYGLCSDAFQQVIVSVDSDGDGLPDRWEMDYFGTLNYGADGDGDDPDQDTYKNLCEYLHGTIPNNPNSKPEGPSYIITIYVPTDASTIQHAINASIDGDTIIVLQGTYKDAGNRDIDFSGKEITVKSTDPGDPVIVAATIIDCEGDWSNQHRGFCFQNGEDYDSVLAGFTITNGYHNDGGAIYCENASPTITNCVISNNASSNGNGGGMCVKEASSPLVKNCIFSGNGNQEGGGSGGGVYIQNSSPSLVNCVFSNNTGGAGGGIYSDNNENTSTKLINCTVSGNYANFGGGVCEMLSDSDEDRQSSPQQLQITNCIFWGNTDGGGYTTEQAQVYYYCGRNYQNQPPTVSYSCIQGWTSSGNCGSLGGSNNTGEDPRFINAEDPAGPDQVFGTLDDGFALQPGTQNSQYSPCIDAGNTAAIDAIDNGGITTDVMGNPRKADGDHNLEGTERKTVDMGAYEVVPIWFVDADRSSGGDGKSWSTAFKYLYSALNANVASNGDEIWVAEGLYKPDTTGLQDTRTATFQLINGVAIYGGFAGTENFRLQRNWENNKTILSGDLNGSNNSYHVVTGANNAVLDGFTITAGNANAPSSPNNSGGGIYCSSTSLKIINCTITGNNSTYGGGIRCSSASPTIINCTITGNNSTSSGGGIYCSYASPAIINCAITANSSSTNGGGIYCNHASPAVANGIIAGNKSTSGRGGGIYNLNSGNPVVTNCTFSKNTARYGGGMYNSSSYSITSCVFIDNNSTNDGGGIYNSHCGNPVITNCTFSKNEAKGGLGGALYNDYAYPKLTNCILWADTAKTSGLEIYNYDSSTKPTFSHCDIKGCGGSSAWAGNDFGLVDLGGNIDVDPCFVDVGNPAGPDGTFGTDDDGLHLSAFDPRNSYLQTPFRGSCLDSADSTVAPLTDITGRPRVDIPYIPNSDHDGTDFADMGAYESPCVWYVKKGVEGKGWSWDFALGDLQEAIKMARPDDEIWVAADEYKPGNDRTDTFLLDKAIAIYGGFAGTEYARHKRNWFANETVLSGEIGDTDSEIKRIDNCFHVVTIKCDGAILDGLTIADGYSLNPEPPYDDSGGGVYIDSSSPQVNNCFIRDNYASFCGGGIYVEDGSPAVANCIFYHNGYSPDSPCGQYGGGMYNNEAAPLVTNCIFSRNHANDAGGAICNYISSAVVTNCLFRENQAGIGSGIYNGAYDCYRYSSLVATNCLFTGNYANGYGASVYNDATNYTSDLMLTNSTFVGNKTYDNPEYDSAEVYVTYGCSSDIDITNCIFWDNGSDYQIYIPSQDFADIQYCDISGGTGGIHPSGYQDPSIIGGDPRFVDSPEFYDRTIADGWINVIVVADASKYQVGDIIDYYDNGFDIYARMVTKVNPKYNIVWFDPPLPLDRPSKKYPVDCPEAYNIRNWGKYAITEPKLKTGYCDYEVDYYKVKEEIARLACVPPGQPGGSPCIDAGTDEGVLLDIYDLDGDSHIYEKIPYDINGVPRIQEIPGYGEDGGQSVDMGVLESGGLIANNKTVGPVAENQPYLITFNNDDIIDLKGGTPTYIIVTDPKHGTTERKSNNEVWYHPHQNSADDGSYNSDIFYYKATDGINYSALAFVSINNITSPPIAVPDEAWINEGQSYVIINVLQNDYDPDRTEVPSLDPTNPIVLDGEYGNATPNQDGTIRYSVKLEKLEEFEERGYDTFRYKIVGGSEAEVTVNLNYKPTANSSALAISTELKIVAVIDALANYKDKNEEQSLEAIILTNPDKGTLALYKQTKMSNVLVYRLVYKPSGTEEYETSFTYKVKDQMGLVSDDETTVSITVNNTTTIADFDKDMISDSDEKDIFGTDPNKSDSDGDGVYDCEEIIKGFDPMNPSWCGYYADPLPYICSFQTNQDYAPPVWVYDEQQGWFVIYPSLNGQLGWKVNVDEGGTCDIRYETIGYLPSLGVSWGCMYARLKAGGTTISKEFKDNGSEDNYSNIIRVKLYPSDGAEVKIISGDTVIAGAQFRSDKKICYWSQGDWQISSTTWPERENSYFAEHNYAMLLEFNFDFSSSPRTCAVLWDSVHNNIDDPQPISPPQSINFDSISRIELKSGTEDFDVRGLYINDREEFRTCAIRNPSTGDQVQESRIPVKGWACSVNMSGYKLEWGIPYRCVEECYVSGGLVNPFDDEKWRNDEGDYLVGATVTYGDDNGLYICRQQSGSGTHSPDEGEPWWAKTNRDMLGYWNTGMLPKGIYHVGIRLYEDLVYYCESFPPRCLPEEWSNAEVTYFDNYVGYVATGGLMRNSTFHYVEEPDISVPWPGEFPFELRRIYDSGRSHIKGPFFAGWTNNNQIILTEYADYYESSGCEVTAKGDVADKDASGLAFGAIYVQYEDGSMHLFRHTTESITTYQATYVPYPDDGSGDYIIRTTEGQVSYIDIADNHNLVIPGLTINYELYRRDGTKIEFHSITNSDPQDPLATAPPDDWPLEYIPKGGAVYKEIPGDWDEPEGLPVYRYFPPEEKWRFVTAVKTKSDRFGNKLYFEWDGYQIDPAVTAVHWDYNGNCNGDIGADNTKITIEFSNYAVGYGYSTAQLIVDGVEKRWVNFLLVLSRPWWDESYSKYPCLALEVFKSESATYPVNPVNGEELTGEGVKDVKVYQDYWGTGDLAGIFNDKLIFSNEGGYHCIPSASAVRTAIEYEWDGEFRRRWDYVDANTYQIRDYWYFFYEPDSGNELDGQCVFTSVDCYDSAYGLSIPYRQDFTIVNEQGQLRAKCSCAPDTLGKIAVYDYYTDSGSDFYNLPFTPHQIREYWHDFDYTTATAVEVGRITENDYLKRTLTFNDDDQTLVNFYNLTKQNTYKMKMTPQGDKLDPAIYPENLISSSQFTYHNYPRYNLLTKKTSYQQLNKETLEHTKPVETEYVYGLLDGTTPWPSNPYDETHKYLLSERVLIYDNDTPEIPNDDDWVVTDYTYNQNGTVNTKTDPEGVGTGSQRSKTYYDYDTFWHNKRVEIGIAEESDSEKPVERYLYDEIGQLLLKADTKGLVTANEYDNFGDIVKVRTYHDPAAFNKSVNDFTPTYYSSSTPRSTTIYGYDLQGRRNQERIFSEETQQEQGSPPDEQVKTAIKRTEYMTGGQPRRITLGEITGFELGNPIVKDSGFVEYAYAGNGQKIVELKYDLTADPSCQWWCTDYYYDGLDRLRATLWYDYENMSILKLSAGNYHGSGKKAYDELWGCDSKGWWEAQGRADYRYDELDRLKEQVVVYDFVAGVPQRVKTEYDYDDAGNLINLTDPLEHNIKYDYDNGNRRIKEYFAAQEGDPSVLKKQTVYYKNSNVEKVTSYDNNGSTELACTEYEYDERGRVKNVTEQIDTGGDTAVTQYQYEDAKDSTWSGMPYANVQITKENDTPTPDNVTRVAYDEQGQTIAIKHPHDSDYSKLEQFEYNGDGTLKSKKVWDGATVKWVEYSYDAFGRLQQTTYPDSGTPGTLTFSYDGFGRRTSVTDKRNDTDRIGGTAQDGAEIIYTYDPLDRIICVTDHDDYNIFYSYRSDGQKEYVAVTPPANPEGVIYAVEYKYDIAGRLKLVSEPLLPYGSQAIAGFSYDDNGNRSQLRYYLTGQESGSTVAVNYTYNPDNMLTRYKTTGGCTFEFGKYSGFELGDATIDGLGRLKYAEEKIAKNFWVTISYNYTYDYDMRSQLKQATINKNGSSFWSAQYTYRKDGNLQTRSGTTFQYNGDLMTQATGSEPFSLTWDDNNGNLTQKTLSPTTDLYYNWDNKVRTGTKGSQSLNLKYDPDGNRVWRKSTVSGQETQRKFIVDIVGDLPVILMEIDPINGPIKKTYIYADGQILAQHDGIVLTDNKYFYLHDRLGSVRQVINQGGPVMNYYTYNPFGEVFATENTENVSNPFKFTGQYYDSEIGEYYLHARQYDPHIARFASRDPVFGNFQEPLTLHRYLYCQNDPVNKVDVTGRWRKGIHNKIIDTAYRDEFSRNERNFIKQGSIYADTFQDPEDSFMHAMRAPNQSIENAQNRMWDFINEHLYYYELYEFIEWHEDALFELGMAMHPIMDSTCPSHEGFQIWEGDWVSHIAREPYFISQQTLQRTTTLMHNEVELFEYWYGY